MLKNIAIICPPALLAIVEMFHLSGHHHSVHETLAPNVDLWITVHLLQLMLFPLTAFTVYWLTRHRSTIIAQISHLLLLIYSFFYGVFDSLAGIATGVLVKNANTLNESDKVIMIAQIQKYFDDPLVGGSTVSIISVLAVVAGSLAFFLTAFELKRIGYSILPAVLLIGAGIGMLGTHAPPRGPITYALVFIAAAIVVFSKREVKSASKA